MNWYYDQVKCKDNCEHVLTLIGRLNAPESGKDIIEIILQICDNNMNVTEKLMYSHNPSISNHDELDPDTIKAKYYHKIRKVISIVEKRDLTQLMN
jgi:hypothetical protein